MQKNNVGQKLKKMRLIKGITLKDVSDATGISVSFLSLVENEKSGISLSNLQKILKLHEQSINDIMDISNGIQDPSYSDTSIVKPQGARVVRSEDAKRIKSELDDTTVLSLVVGTKGKKMWPGLFTMEPGTTIGPFNHEGEELSYMLQGKIEATLENTETGEKEIYIITEGDTIYYPSTLTHTYVNLSKQKSIFLAVCTPPSF